MPRVVITAKAKDLEAWEAGFRSMSELLESIYASPIGIGTRAEDNSFAFSAEVKDTDHFLSLMNSEKAKQA